MNKGIAVAGNMIVDMVKVVSDFPQRHGLVKLLSVAQSFGGAVPNVLRDLARLDPALPLAAIGLVGRDDYGEALLRELAAYPSIDLSRVGRAGSTSFSDVLTEEKTRARTFLTYPGSSALLGRAQFDLKNLDADILHIGYILLLDALDAPDAEFGTQMARLLHDARAQGIRTSVDVVSEVGDRHRKLVPPALAHVDYLIVNELEAGAICGLALRDEGDRLLTGRMREALSRLHAMGKMQLAVIHAPEGGFGMDARGQYARVPSVQLPAGFIRGTVGAGDAFCAGVLLAQYRGMSLENSLEAGIASAVCALSEADACSGVRPLAQALAFVAPMARQKLEG